MSGDVKVIEDGVDNRSSSQPVGTTSPWVWLAIGIAIGLGFALVFFTPSTTGDATDSPEVASPEPTAATPTTIFDDGVSARVADFPDAVVAVAAADGGSLQHVIWPAAGPHVARPLPGGDFGQVSFDYSGTWLAASTGLPGGDGYLLAMGKTSNLAPLASDVTSFAWHDSRPGVLSYTERTDDGEWVLKVVGADRNPREVTRGIGIEGEVAAWGDWGWAIQSAEDRVTLLTDEGEIKTYIGGVALDSHPSGWIVTVNGDGLRMVSAGGGVVRLDIRFESIGGVGDAKLSPDRQKIALVGPHGLKVAQVNGHGEVITVPFSSVPRQDAVAWSSDSRFVILPRSRGVMFLDYEGGGKIVTDLMNTSLITVAVIS